MMLFIQTYLPQTVVVAAVDSLATLRQVIRKTPFDFLIMEIHGKSESIIDFYLFMKEIQLHWINKPFLLWSEISTRFVRHLITQHTLNGIIKKSDSLTSLMFQLEKICGFLREGPVHVASIDFIEPYDISLTPQESRAISYFMTGYNSHHIAKKMNLTIKTVSTHKRSAMRKLGVKNNVELLALYKYAFVI
ncbi:LuxR C-terminal-related transcriptional regulator [Serratia sp. OS31]|uniref:helix-turn-helix transcriptional regulator n=1 Tax=Serratia sp. OS31 TaxID=2760844 RepID=UPI0015FFA40F|nr:LuxR C-terminal-related transcriptional regulator [Serratia sp. OS31]MBB1585012.1 response regulator transcription factor [Serratia sp. OS31]